MPRVSIILPVYNGEPYLAEAIKSILGQTFCDFELIIINDGSKDGSAACVAQFSDSRLKYFEQANAGLAATLNRGISLAAGEYIARQDQDDISHPERLAAQVAFLNEHQDYCMVGTWAEIFSEMESGMRFHRHPTDNLELKLHLHFRNPFVHSSMMLRASAVRGIGGYSTDKTRQPPEDYELWSRMAKAGKLANIPRVLVRYRELSSSMSRVSVAPFTAMLHKIASENMALSLEGCPEARAGLDLVSLLLRYPQPLHMRSSNAELRQAMRCLVSRLCVDAPGEEPSLMAKADAFLKPYLLENAFISRLPAPIRSHPLFLKLKGPLRRLYKALRP